ncbi:SDR family NAD(P)-dependent oxidoreductase [Adhaeribacter radiodurans]|uniref:SDR family NAD(P)-dependent oxidoreductase n=1 Tax=Adhaeribacter radiodurans TaxID=2745197 RepID=A0A7L7L9H8_9BACT|nr:SDR family NAD(P)-dependent oxidoreductase [Adhaeribacter radiodurans]QMU29039.1 SDR family NAD(P)-dependent oxidoreductase [Adhaeribacter radiodurans]
MKNNIAGKVVIITGASSGLGEAAAKHLAALGATVVLGARRADRIEKLAKEMQDMGGHALAVSVDVTQRDQVKQLVDTAVEKFGRVIEEIRPGDVVWFAPHEKHWHGATATTAMTHIAIQESLNGKPVDWMEKVTEDQYNSSN